MAVDLRCEIARGETLKPALRRDALRILRFLKLVNGELSLVLVSDRGIRRLNREYRGKDKATDVLSFPLNESGEIDAHPKGAGRRSGGEIKAKSDSPAPPFALGDVVISVETAWRQARTLDETLPARMRTLLIHGTLHLLGFDHERSRSEAQRMFAKERELASLLTGRRSNGAKDAGTHAELSPAMVIRPRRRTSRYGGACSG